MRLTLDQFLEYANIDGFAQEDIRRVVQPLFDLNKQQLGHLAECVSLARAKGIVGQGPKGIIAGSVYAAMKELIWAVWRAK